MDRFEAPRLPTTLRLGAVIIRRSHVVGLLAALVAVPLGLIVAVLLYAIQAQEGGRTDPRGLLQAVWRAFFREPENEWLLWLAVLALPVAIGLILCQRLASIRVTSVGIQARIPRWLGIGLMDQTAGDWQFQWDTVRAVRLEVPAGARNPLQRLNWYRLVIDTGHGEIRINPLPWLCPHGPDHRPGLGELIAYRRLDARERVRAAPLVRILESRGLVPEAVEVDTHRKGTAADAGFDLARHKGMRVQLGLLAVAAGYAIADAFFLGRFQPLEAMPAWPYGVVAAITALIAWRLGRGAPRTERLGVSLLTVVVVVATVYPAMLRYNALTAVPRTAAYVATGPGRFEAIDRSLPSIDLSGQDLAEYWAAYPPGARHRFTLLRGRGGFWQLDPAPMYARTRAFYRERSR